MRNLVWSVGLGEPAELGLIIFALMLSVGMLGLPMLNVNLRLQAVSGEIDEGFKGCAD